MPLAAAAARVRAGEELSAAETRELFGRALRPGCDEQALAELLLALAERGERPAEIAGAAAALRAAMPPFDHGCPEAVDTCGTGGDGLASFNLSTAAALVAAAAGARVVKHGNRSVSSKCGSADLLEAAGVRLELDPAAARRVFERCGIVFLFAPAFHPAMRFAAPVRRRLGVRTIFNFLGPLCNPGSVRRHLLGVSAPERLDDLAGALDELGFERAYVVHGAGGADELTLAGANRIRRVGSAPALPADAVDLGLPRAGTEALAGGDAAVNLRLLRDLLEGEDGPLRAALLYNAAAALLAAGVEEEAAAALERAAAAVDSGDARRLLERWAAASAEESG
ncbi:MAG: anthranilate phosphoribosyltransferase [Planctomycetota bacterium]|nr:MAG: anthranilate phosphoribosyltransferase [Planctomycetota bacterium]